MAIVASTGTAELVEGILELAEYREEDPIATAFNVGNSFYAQNEFWRQSAPKTPAEIMKFYRESVPGVAQQVFATYGILTEIALRARICTFALPGSTVLDFGAGIGSQILPLAAKRVRCTHVDVGGEQFDYAGWRYRSRSLPVEMVALQDDYMKNGIEELRGRKWNTVICTEVLEHVTDPEGLAALLADYVLPDGLLIATTSFDDGDGMVPMHLNIDRYTDEEFERRVFPSHGFKQIEPAVYKRLF
jgi:2-polyprenyl-3-methyl-5-hydroxy-6-metoxy-1,4-benzoquinol methylase